MFVMDFIDCNSRFIGLVSDIHGLFFLATDTMFGTLRTSFSLDVTAYFKGLHFEGGM